MSGFSVPRGEHGRQHVFQLAADGFSAEPDAPEVAAAFGGAADPHYIYVVETKALTSVGLTGYMIEGLHAKPEALAADAAKLNALTGHVAVVLSEAFHGAGYEGPSEPRVAWIGSYGEYEMAVTAPAIETESADGTVGSGGRPDAAGPGQMRFWAWVAAAVIAVPVLALLLWWAG